MGKADINSLQRNPKLNWTWQADMTALHSARVWVCCCIVPLLSLEYCNKSPNGSAPPQTVLPGLLQSAPGHGFNPARVQCLPLWPSQLTWFWKLWQPPLFSGWCKHVLWHSFCQPNGGTAPLKQIYLFKILWKNKIPNKNLYQGYEFYDHFHIYHHHK